MFDRYLVAAAYHIVASHFHSGQWSNGYMVLCRTERMGLKLADSAYRRDSEERAEAARLLWSRRAEVRRSW